MRHLKFYLSWPIFGYWPLAVVSIFENLRGLTMPGSLNLLLRILSKDVELATYSASNCRWWWTMWFISWQRWGVYNPSFQEFSPIQFTLEEKAHPRCKMLKVSRMYEKFRPTLPTNKPHGSSGVSSKWLNTMLCPSSVVFFLCATALSLAVVSIFENLRGLI
jgi:hypothetical protein